MNEKTLIFHNDCRLNNRCAKYKTCPIILVHKLLSGKWKILILWYLSNETLRFSELKKKLRKSGCYKIREGGNHEIWYSPKTETAFSVGRHDGQEIATGTANKILKDAGLK